MDGTGEVRSAMKIVAISQRVDEIKDYGEIRDALDEQWHNLFRKMDAVLLPMPNMPESVDIILERLRPDAIVLSGGNNPVEYGGTTPGRDKVDEMLIQYALDNGVPLLGVCRGMQSIALYFGSTLKKVEGHVATEHEVIGEIQRVVNSYHSYAVDKLGDKLHVMARTKQGDIEAIQHQKHMIFGIMWHPERVKGFDESDIDLIREMLAL